MAEATTNGWTIETVREHLTALMEERDRRYEQRFAGIEEATNKKSESLEKRFDGVNEFRGAMNDAAGKYITKSEALSLVVAVCALAGVVEFALTYFVHR